MPTFAYASQAQRFSCSMDACSIIAAATFVNAQVIFLRRFGEYHSLSISLIVFHFNGYVQVLHFSHLVEVGGDACTLACTLYCIVWGKCLPALACKCVLSFRYGTGIVFGVAIQARTMSHHSTRAHSLSRSHYATSATSGSPWYDQSSSSGRVEPRDECAQWYTV